MKVSIWQGTEPELVRLREAVEQHCECQLAADGAPGTVCPAHAVLLDQCVLDHLLFGYRRREIFLRGEFNLNNRKS